MPSKNDAGTVCAQVLSGLDVRPSEVIIMVNPDTESSTPRPDPLTPPGEVRSNYDKYSSTSTSQAGTTSGNSEPHSTNAGAKAREMADQMRHEAHRLTEEAKSRGRSLLEGQKEAAAAEIEGMANALQTTAQQLSEQEQPSTAHYVYRASETLARMAGALRDRDFGALIKQTEDFARHQPGVFLGGAVATGFLLSRFLKSSAERSKAGYDPATEGQSDPTVYEPATMGPGSERKEPSGTKVNIPLTGEY